MRRRAPATNSGPARRERCLARQVPAATTSRRAGGRRRAARKRGGRSWGNWARAGGRASRRGADGRRRLTVNATRRAAARAMGAAVHGRWRPRGVRRRMRGPGCRTSRARKVNTCRDGHAKSGPTPARGGPCRRRWSRGCRGPARCRWRAAPLAAASARVSGRPRPSPALAGHAAASADARGLVHAGAGIGDRDASGPSAS